MRSERYNVRESEAKWRKAWADAPVAGQTDTDIENAILTKARQLRLSNLNGRG